MKKLSLILILFFAYFVCITDVLAFQSYCGLIDSSSNPGYIYMEDCTFDGTVIVATKYTEDGPNGRFIDEIDSDAYSYSNGTLVTNYNLFGYYQSSGNLIPYVRPPYADDWTGNKIVYRHHNYTYTDSYGNVESYVQFSQPKTIDIDFGVQTPVNRTNRLDFAVHFNLTDTPEIFRRTVLDNLQLDVFMPFGSNQSYCTSVRQNDIFHITCSFIAEQTNPVVRITNTLSDNYTFSEEYMYKMYLDISNYALVIGPDDAIFNEDYNNIESPNGSLFDDNYTKLQGEANTFFGNFTTSNYNGLTRIVAAPLLFIRNLNSESFTDLNVSIFGKTITLKNGNDLFWNTDFQNHKTIRVGSYSCNQYCLVNIRNNFVLVWSNLFGLWLVYLSMKKLLLVIFGLVNPDKTSVEVF